MKYQLIALLVLSLNFNLAWADSNIEGSWRGEKFKISTSDTFDTIRGHWGETTIDLSVSDTFQQIRGRLGSSSVDLNISNTFSQVRGQLPCGSVNYNYSVTFEYVRGTLCGQSFEINLENPSDVVPTAEHILLEEILTSFPRPAHGAVRRFILSRIRF